MTGINVSTFELVLFVLVFAAVGWGLSHRAKAKALEQQAGGWLTPRVHYIAERIAAATAASPAPAVPAAAPEPAKPSAAKTPGDETPIQWAARTSAVPPLELLAFDAFAHAAPATMTYADILTAYKANQPKGA